MPDHFVVLRHQDGDAWDHVVITHLGPRATVEAAGTAVPPDKRDLSAWHTDTFVNGPSWAEFTRAMGIDADSKSKTKSSVYSVSHYRPAPGHREQLEKMLSEVPSAPNDTTAGNVLMQHLEGANWSSSPSRDTIHGTILQRVRRALLRTQPERKAPGRVCAITPIFTPTRLRIA